LPELWGTVFRDIRHIVHIAYIDETLSQEKSSPYVVVGALIIPNGRFRWTEGRTSVVASGLLPEAGPEQLQDLEFHARDLFKGEGPFRGIGYQERMGAINGLLANTWYKETPFIYSAVDRSALASVPVFGSANAIDVALRNCLVEINSWVAMQWSKPPYSYGDGRPIEHEETCLCILDDTKDHVLKSQLKATYRKLRPKFLATADPSRLRFLHDAVYFGDSAESLGIQLADLCCYFTRRRLEGKKDEESLRFWRKFVGRAKCAKPQPEWTEYRRLFVAHDEPDGKSHECAGGWTCEVHGIVGCPLDCSDRKPCGWCQGYC
jgi:hypothetical protein